MSEKDLRDTRGHLGGMLISFRQRKGEVGGNDCISGGISVCSVLYTFFSLLFTYLVYCL